MRKNHARDQKSSVKTPLAVLGVVGLALCLAFLAGFYKPIALGLDVQGGLEVVLQATPKKGQKVTADDLTQSVEIIRDRVDQLGVSEPEIRTQGTDQIAISIPGIKDADAAVDLIGSTAQLYFYDFQKSAIGKAYRTPYTLLKRNQGRADKALAKAKAKEKKDGTPFDEQYFLFDPKHKKIAGPIASKDEVLERWDDKKLPKGWEILFVPPGEKMFRGDPNQLPLEVDTTGRLNRKEGVYVLFKDQPALSGQEIKRASPATQQGGYVTSIQFTDKGGELFGDVTADIARAGALAGTPLTFAIVLDDEIKSNPSIDYKDYPNGIRGNQAQITGLDSREEAEGLALVLNTGALPVRFEIISKNEVSATLGKQSLREAMKAGLVGLVLVMIYLVLFYRFLGLIADVALLMYGLLLYGLVVYIPITMTLPGIAGMILTIGVAADANIIIFERIREEYRAGRSVRASITQGYSKGVHTIIDANAVTLITALVLFVVGTGTVRGFALLLGVGVILSMLTAVAATYAMLGLLGSSKAVNHPFMIGGSRKPQRLHLPFMRMRKTQITLAILFIFVAGGIGLVNGLNLGIDFKGGSKIDVRLEKSASVEEIRKTLTSVSPKLENATIQQTKEVGAKANDAAYSIRAERISTDSAKQERAENQIERALDKEFGVKAEGFSVQTIGASFGKQVLNSAILAVIVSIFLLCGYIAMRFEWKYAIPVVIAIIHDITFATAAYSITGREFTSATVAALLTILGYSLYDTIIVFDRIRENVSILRKSSFARIVEVSSNEVLTRSINTSIVVLFPIAGLMIFGGETLKDFAFALLVGILVGAFSSLSVAAPILSWIKEQEPVWKRRREAEDASRGLGGPAVEAAAPAPDAAAETAPASSTAAPASGRNKSSRAARRSGAGPRKT